MRGHLDKLDDRKRMVFETPNGQGAWRIRPPVNRRSGVVQLRRYSPASLRRSAFSATWRLSMQS